MNLENKRFFHLDFSFVYFLFLFPFSFLSLSLLFSFAFASTHCLSCWITSQNLFLCISLVFSRMMYVSKCGITLTLVAISGGKSRKIIYLLTLLYQSSSENNLTILKISPYINSYYYVFHFFSLFLFLFFCVCFLCKLRIIPIPSHRIASHLNQLLPSSQATKQPLSHLPPQSFAHPTSSPRDLSNHCLFGFAVFL